MEFRFRADDDRNSTYFSSSSSDSYFTEQALRAGFISNDIRRTGSVTNPDPIREKIQRELEKERIREEIIASEILRKRTLEAEVRRELAMERDLALRRAEGFSLVATSSAPSMWSEPRVSLLHRSDGSRFEERLLSFSAHPEVGGFERLPFQRHPEAARVTEVSKGQVMLLAKPMSSNLAGTKRKVVAAAAAAGASELAIVGSKKKPNNEWSCALCQVSATCEQGLNDHLQGKKHKAKEAELRASRAASKHPGSSTPLSKKTDKPTKLTKINSSPNLKHGKKQEEKPVQTKQQQVRRNGEVPVQKKQKTEDLKKRRFKIWCEHCQIGCHSETVMAAHRTGKKHMARVESVKQNGGAVLEKAEDEAEEANEEAMENADGEVDGVEEAEEAAGRMVSLVDELAEVEANAELEDDLVEP